MSDVKPLTEVECALAMDDIQWGAVPVRRALATIADLRAKLAEAERERDGLRDAINYAGEPITSFPEHFARCVGERNAALAEARALREALEGLLAIISVIEAHDTFTGKPMPASVCGITLGSASDAALGAARLALRGKEADRG